jgi:PncC family amidohydrolase
LVRRAAEKGCRIVAAESCTAGLVADLLARVPGASRVLWGSFVTYTIPAKIRMLNIDADLLKTHGAVSRETALAMAVGALAESGADLAVSVTGLAGPEGDGTTTPVGTVWMGLAWRGVPPVGGAPVGGSPVNGAPVGGGAEARMFHYKLPRNELRGAAAMDALRLLYGALEQEGAFPGG